MFLLVPLDLRPESSQHYIHVCIQIDQGNRVVKSSVNGAPVITIGNYCHIFLEYLESLIILPIITTLILAETEIYFGVSLQTTPSRETLEC